MAPESARSASPDRPANRLASESSPYLLQHAHNPVDWFPWGPEAFEEARRRNVPIFLSVGYSTCYWCHVMERESFEDPQTAALLNERFVCVKVDREERPDVDDIAMHACQALTGRGGWPLSVFLTPPTDDDAIPSLAPFWAGTYFPPEPRHNLPSFAQVIGGIGNAWRDQREQIVAQAARIADMLSDTLAARTLPVRIGHEQLDGATNALIRMYDRTNGGFGSSTGGPKFPQPVFLEFIIDRLDDPIDIRAKQALGAALTHTLERMALGGINDQIGGGFHRYSVEPTWTVPHFEKMLYDNAQLASTYARASAMFEKDPYAPEALFARTVRETLDYALREMRVQGAPGQARSADPDSSNSGAPGHPDPDSVFAFASAQDAEVNGKEGDNYLWTPDEFANALDSHDLSFALKVFALDRGPNFQDPHHPSMPPRNVLVLDERPEHLAERFNLSTKDFLTRLGKVRCRLYAARAEREQPHRDDKVIAAWNGLMLAALADGATLLKDAKYLDAAESCASFILSTLRDSQDNLLRIWRDGKAQTPAFLEDYAMLAFGLVRTARANEALGRASAKHIDAASDLITRAFAQFGDETGALYDTRADQPDLVVRAMSRSDGAMPCGQSVMLHTLLDLHDLTRDPAHLDRAGMLLASMSATIHETPLGAINSTRALRRFLKLDPSLLAKYGMVDERPRIGPDVDPNEQTSPPVEVFADVDGFHLEPGEAQEFTIELRIREGYHITANKPYGDDVPVEQRVEGLIGLEVGVAGGRGVILGCDYPEGEPFEPEIAKGRIAPILTHKGTLRLDITAYRSTEDEWFGEPKVAVRFQACNDRECAQPMTAVLEVGITRKEA
jgi:uncharacterized protein YyaL (SSP411 family)